jgi:phosphoglycolate phosphatase-like HAD superfamily hydrolase
MSQTNNRSPAESQNPDPQAVRLEAQIRQLEQQREEAKQYLEDGISDGNHSMILPGLMLVKAAADATIAVLSRLAHPKEEAELVNKIYEGLTETIEAFGPETKPVERLLRMAGVVAEAITEQAEGEAKQVKTILKVGSEFGQAGTALLRAMEAPSGSERRMALEDALTHWSLGLAALRENHEKTTDLLQNLVEIKHEIQEALEKIKEANEENERLEKMLDGQLEFYDRLIDRAKNQLRIYQLAPRSGPLPPVPTADRLLKPLKGAIAPSNRAASRVRNGSAANKGLRSLTRGVRPPAPAASSPPAMTTQSSSGLTPGAGGRSVLHGSPYAAVQGASGRYMLVPKTVVPNAIAQGIWTPDQIANPQDVPPDGWLPRQTGNPPPAAPVPNPMDASTPGLPPLMDPSMPNNIQQPTTQPFPMPADPADGFANPSAAGAFPGAPAAPPQPTLPPLDPQSTIDIPPVADPYDPNGPNDQSDDDTPTAMQNPDLTDDQIPLDDDDASQPAPAPQNYIISPADGNAPYIGTLADVPAGDPPAPAMLSWPGDPEWQSRMADDDPAPDDEDEDDSDEDEDEDE